MSATQDEQAPWLSNADLEDHYWTHHWDVGAGSIPEYDASARATIRHGTRFTYNDPLTGQARIGYFDPTTELFTALRGNGAYILTHFRPDDGEAYPLGLPNSTYR